MLNEEGREYVVGDYNGYTIIGREDDYGWYYVIEGDEEREFREIDDVKKYIDLNSKRTYRNVCENRTPRRIFLTESQVKKILGENVYVGKTDGKNAFLTYNGRGKNIGRKNSVDYLKTDKMEENNGDTYEIMLKGGIMSYNITSIKGMEVMHYFKRLWDNEKTFIKGDDKNIYELKMLKDEENAFLQKFVSKVNFVIDYWINSNKNVNEYDFSKVSIYPVPSSSNFNEKMCELMSGMSLFGLPIQIIDQNLLKKDLKSLEIDQDFIDKNKDYFYGNMGNSETFNYPVVNFLKQNLNKREIINKTINHIDKINVIIKEIVNLYYRYNNIIKQGKTNEKLILRLSELYIQYCDLLREIKKETYLKADNKNGRFDISMLADKKKYIKGPSVDKRSDEIFNLIKPLLMGKTSQIDGKPYKKEDIVEYNKTPFQIKMLTNGERMGVKNIYSITDDKELIEKEIERIKGSIFVIFDDNISGGATLSDICYQLKKIGINNIIPITFGEMEEKWTQNKIPLNKPEMKDRHAIWNN